jgi:hypothetical protein
VGVGLGIECIAGMIDVFFHFFGNRARSKAFERVEPLEREMLSNNGFPRYFECYGSRNAMQRVAPKLLAVT